MNAAYEQALELDAADMLSWYRSRFFIDEHTPVYLDGNSLGMLSRDSLSHLHEVIAHQWGERLIRSWNEGWYELALKLGEKLSPIIGSGPGEAVFSDSTSVNLYKLAHGAVSCRKSRKKIVSDALNFPTDLYVLQGIAETLGEGRYVELAESSDGITVTSETLDDIIDADTSLVVLSQVAFKSGFLYDMKEVTEIAHRKGALILWDLSHSAGALPVDLRGANADLAVGCSYKYLNGGPGAPAFLYVSQPLQEHISSPVWGWFSDADPFSFSLQYTGAENIQKYLAGTPPVLSLAGIEPALGIILEAGIDRLREKSVRQSEYLIALADEHLEGTLLGSPRDASLRGSHVSLRHPEAYRICKALIDPPPGEPAVIPDFRTPDNIRLGITPLYTSFADIAAALRRIEQILHTREYERHSRERAAVT